MNALISKFRRLGIRQKFTAAVGFSLLVIGIFIFTFFPMRQKAQLTQSLKERGYVIAQIVAKGAAAGLTFDDASAVNGALESLPQIQDVAFAVVLRKDGSIIAVFQDTAARAFLATLKDGRSSEGRIVEAGNAIVAIAPVRSSGEVLGSVLVGVGTQRLDEEVASSRWVALIVAASIVVIGIVGVSKLVRDVVTRPISRMVEVADKLARGDMNVRIDIESQDEMGTLARSFAVVIGEIQGLLGETGQLVRWVSEGELEKRGNAERFSGAFRSLVEGMNTLMESVAVPVGETRRILGQLASNDTTGSISAKYPGIWQAMALSIGDVQERIRHIAAVAKQISAGDLHELPELKRRGRRSANDEIMPAFVTMMEAIQLLLTDTAALSTAVIHGRASTRVDEKRHSGDYRTVMAGVNRTLDSLVGIIDVMPVPCLILGNDFRVLYVNQAGTALAGKTRGDIEGRPCYEAFRTLECQTDECAGCTAIRTDRSASRETTLTAGTRTLDIESSAVPIKDEQGWVIGAFETLVDRTSIKEAARKSDKIVAYQQGEAARMVKSLEILALGNLQTAIELKDGDADTRMAYETLQSIRLAVRKFCDAVVALGADLNELSQAALEGRLSSRVNVQRHSGDFATIVNGLNATLDALIQPIQESASILASMAQGDLTVRVRGQYQGDHEILKTSINTVAVSLDRALGEVSEAIASTAGASSQISSSTEEMAAGAHEQDSQAGQVVCAVEQMTRTILENAKNASMTAETARQSRLVAEQGGEAVQETLHGMRRIADVVIRSARTVKELGVSSNQIGEIISVIDDIADQTNLLALNAAIEAARAGEQGRGFAVVADEVRKLAERTTKATKEIAQMIKKIQADTGEAVRSMEQGTAEVEQGIALADKAGISLTEIVGVSQQVTEMISRIAKASEEQSGASEQISKNVEGISAVTSETSAGIQSIARAAEDLNHLTESLHQMVIGFRVSSLKTQATGKDGGVLRLA